MSVINFLKKAYWDTSAYLSHSFGSKPKSRQEELDAHYKKYRSYEGFKLKKGEVIKNGYIYNEPVHQGAKSKVSGAGPSIMSEEGKRQYGKDIPEQYNPTRVRNEKGLYGPSDNLC